MSDTDFKQLSDIPKKMLPKDYKPPVEYRVEESKGQPSKIQYYERGEFKQTILLVGLDSPMITARQVAILLEQAFKGGALFGASLERKMQQDKEKS